MLCICHVTKSECYVYVTLLNRTLQPAAGIQELTPNRPNPRLEKTVPITLLCNAVLLPKHTLFYIALIIAFPSLTTRY